MSDATRQATQLRSGYAQMAPDRSALAEKVQSLTDAEVCKFAD
jgi:hypothetical protein